MHFNETVHFEYFTKVFIRMPRSYLACQISPSEDGKKFGEQSDRANARETEGFESEAIATGRDARSPGACLQARSQHNFRF